MFTIHDLNAFVAVVEAGSVGAAARSVHRTQSAVSQALRRLEAATGVPLMDRSEYRLRPTQAGQQFFQRVKAHVGEAEALRRFAALLAAGTEERVRIAMHGALPSGLWADQVASVVRMFPDTVIEIKAGEVDSPKVALLNGEADLALLILPPSTPGLDMLEHVPIGYVRFAGVVRHDLAGCLATLPQIVVSDFRAGSSTVGVAEGQRRCRVGSHAAKLELILRGAGWGNVPEEMAQTALAEGLLRRLDRPGRSRGTAHAAYLYQAPAQPRGPVLSALWQAFVASGRPEDQAAGP